MICAHGHKLEGANVYNYWRKASNGGKIKAVVCRECRRHQRRERYRTDKQVATEPRAGPGKGGQNNQRATLNWLDVFCIRCLAAEMPQTRLCEIFKVSNFTISMIVRNRLWCVD
jgi:hypothetical protein